MLGLLQQLRQFGCTLQAIWLTLCSILAVPVYLRVPEILSTVFPGAPVRNAPSVPFQVSHIVTPNTEHQKFAPFWIREFPNASSWACPGLREAKPEGGWQASLEELMGSLRSQAVRAALGRLATQEAGEPHALHWVRLGVGVTAVIACL